VAAVVLAEVCAIAALLVIFCVQVLTGTVWKLIQPVYRLTRRPNLRSVPVVSCTTNITWVALLDHRLCQAHWIFSGWDVIRCVYY